MRLRFLLCAAAAAMLSGAAHAQKDDEDKPTPAQILSNAPANDWRPVDLDNLVVMELPAGKVLIELRPDFAPGHAARIKELAREGFYDGIVFHRVIEGFVAQAGDPKGDGTGGSDKPDLQPEFLRHSSEVEGFVEIGRDRIASRVGFVDGMPAAADPESLASFRADRKVETWGLHCPGVMSMARTAAPDSANSQFFLMIGEARLSLDKRYTVWGWIVDGMNAARRIDRGEPPPRPTPIMRMRVAADMPAGDQPNIEVLRTDSDTFKRYIEAAGLVNETGLVRDVCAIKPPRKVNGEIRL